MGISSMQRGPYGAVALGIHRNCISNWIYNNKLALIDNSVFICLVVVVLEGGGGSNLRVLQEWVPCIHMSLHATGGDMSTRPPSRQARVPATVLRSHSFHQRLNILLSTDTYK